LPDAKPNDIRGLVEVLVGQDTAAMDKVKKFLFDVFVSYKLRAGGKRIAGVVIDELENITQPERETEPKLAKLLQGLFESAVRELVDRAESLSDPDVLVIFDIISKKELEKGGWLRADVLERSDAWTFDINLTRNSANELMRRLLRLYLDAVVGKLGADSSDDRAKEWAEKLAEHANLEDDLYTYPVTRSVHKAFSHALLDTVPATEAVLSFRAYQQGIHILLSSWAGIGVIDLPFMLQKADELRQYFGEKYTGVNLDRLLDTFAVQAYVRKEASGVRAALRELLGNLTVAALLKSTSSSVLVSRDDLARVLERDDIPTQAVVDQLLHQVEQHEYEEWETVGDSLRVNTEFIVERVAEQISEAERDFVQEAIEATAGSRRRPLEQIAQSALSAKGKHDAHIENGLLVVKPKQQPLFGRYFFSFQGSTVRTVVGRSRALSIGVRIAPRDIATENELPVSVEIALPPPLKRFEEPMAARLRAGLEARWNVYRLVADKFIHDGGLDPATSLIESVKLSILADQGQVPFDLRDKLATYERDFVTWFLADIQLTDAARNTWIAYAFGFNEFHPIDAVNRLIRVLAWATDPDLRYSSRESVHDSVGVVRVELGSPDQWSSELRNWESTESFVRDGVLLPYEAWPKALRARVEEVDELLAGDVLSFAVLADHLLGGASIQRVPGAHAMLHLLLRLGAKAKDWLVQDETSEYRDVRLTSKSQSLAQARQRLAHKIGSLLEDVLTTEILEGADGTHHVSDLLQLRAELSSASSLEEITEVGSRLPEVEPPAVSTFIPPTDFQYLDAPWVEVVRYLDFISDVQGPQGTGGRLIHGRLAEYQDTLALEAKYLLRLKRRNALAGFAGAGEEKPPDKMILREVAQQDSAGTTTAGRAAARELTTKVDQKSHLISKESLDAYEEIVEWATELLDTVIPADLRSSVIQADLDRLEGETAEFEQHIRDQAGQLLARARQAEQEMRLALRSAAPAEGSKIRAMLDQLGDALTVAGTIDQQVSPPAVSALAAATELLQVWNSLAQERLARRQKEIEVWLEARGLGGLREQITAELASVNTPLLEVYRQLVKAGLDVFAELRVAGPVHERLAALFGAAGIVDALETAPKEESATGDEDLQN
jgi:hypothetical protein